MPRSTFFVQPCPTCGRRVEVPVEYLGKQVVCDHCQGAFMAMDPALDVPASDDSSIILRRANQLLATVDQRQRAG
ncbi:MAG: hypothetical protein WD176_06560 [Pirellulales bacterium]